MIRLTGHARAGDLKQIQQELSRLDDVARAARLAQLPLVERFLIDGNFAHNFYSLLVRLRHDPKDAEALEILGKLGFDKKTLPELQAAIRRHSRGIYSDKEFLDALRSDTGLKSQGVPFDVWSGVNNARLYDEFGRMFKPGASELMSRPPVKFSFDGYDGPQKVYIFEDAPDIVWAPRQLTDHFFKTDQDLSHMIIQDPVILGPGRSKDLGGEMLNNYYGAHTVSPEGLAALEAQGAVVHLKGSPPKQYSRFRDLKWEARLKHSRGSAPKYEYFDLDGPEFTPVETAAPSAHLPSAPANGQPAAKELAPPSKPIEIQNGEIVVPPGKPTVPFGPTAVPPHLDPIILPGGTLSPIILPGGTLSDPTLTGALLMSGARRGVPGKLRDWLNANKPGWIFENLGHGSLARRPYLGQLKDGRPVYMESELAAPKAGEVYWSEYGLYTYLQDKGGTLRRQALPKQPVYDGRQYTPAKSDITPEQGTLFFDFARGLRNGRGGSQMAGVQTLVPAAIKPGETFQYNNGRIARCISISNGRPVMQLLPESERVQPTWRAPYNWALRTDNAKAPLGMTQAGLYDPAGGFTIYDPALTYVGAKPVKPVVSGRASSGSPAAAHQSQSSVLGGKSQVSTHSTSQPPVPAGAQAVTSQAAAPTNAPGSAASGSTSSLGRLLYELTQTVAYPTRATIGAPGNIFRLMQGKPLNTPHIGGIPRLTNIMASASPTPLSCFSIYFRRLVRKMV